jgi:hypothetical protein
MNTILFSKQNALFLLYSSLYNKEKIIKLKTHFYTLLHYIFIIIVGLLLLLLLNFFFLWFFGTFIFDANFCFLINK